LENDGTYHASFAENYDLHIPLDQYMHMHKCLFSKILLTTKDGLLSSGLYTYKGSYMLLNISRSFN